MGFLDVQIPDWLKPQSPAEQSATRDRAILTGMEIGARAATQRAYQDHDLLMRKLQMGQQLDEFNQQMQLHRDEFAAKKSIQDLQYTAMKQEAQDTPLFTSFLERVGRAGTPEEVLNVPVGGIASPKLLAQSEAARLARVQFLNNIKATSAKEQTRASWIKFGESISNRHLGAGSGILSIATKGGDLTPDDITKMQEFVNTAKEDEQKQREHELDLRWGRKELGNFDDIPINIRHAIDARLKLAQTPEDFDTAYAWGEEIKRQWRANKGLPIDVKKADDVTLKDKAKSAINWMLTPTPQGQPNFFETLGSAISERASDATSMLMKRKPVESIVESPVVVDQSGIPQVVVPVPTAPTPTPTLPKQLRKNEKTGRLEYVTP